MNKTLSIALAGFSFTIEEHAYIKLSDYLTALRSSLDSGEADEVMHDIEIRMVEIFKDSLGKREVINNEDVERVIAQLGTPEAIEQQEEAYYSENTSKKQQKTNYTDGNKQLFRDPENAKLGGVCAGLAYYTGIDVSWMRVIWTTLAIVGIFTGFPTLILILVYIILWAILPVAKTTSDYLKMQGKPINFDTIKEESNKIVQFTNEAGQKVGEMYNESKPVINSAGNGAWNVIRYLLGGFFVMISIGSIISAFFGFAFFANSDFEPVSQMNFYFEDSNMMYIISLLIVISCLIPAILFGLLALKLLAPKTKVRNIGWVLGGLFILLIGLSTYFGVNMAKKDMFLKGNKEDTEEVAIATTSDSLFVDVKQVTIPQNFKGYDDNLYSDKKEVFEEDYPYIEVTRRMDVKTPYLIIKKEAKGYNIPIQMNVPVEINGNKILVPNFVKYPYEHRFRNYNVTYELVVPQNVKVFNVKDNLQLEDNLDEDDNDDDNSISIEKNKISINGKTIEYNSDDKDSIIINGKKVSSEEADKIMDSLDSKMDKMKNVDIKIKDGKKEISITTK
ncbi:MAG: PspC domain-containing protein [Bergeyella sp.]